MSVNVKESTLGIVDLLNSAAYNPHHPLHFHRALVCNIMCVRMSVWNGGWAGKKRERNPVR